MINESISFYSNSSKSSEKPEPIPEVVEHTLLRELKQTMQELPALQLQDQGGWQHISTKVMAQELHQRRFNQQSKFIRQLNSPKRTKLTGKKPSSSIPKSMLLLRSRRTGFMMISRRMMVLPLSCIKEPLRRRSCGCVACDCTKSKQNKLPFQTQEVCMHRKVRLANILLGTIFFTRNRKNCFYNKLSSIKERMVELKVTYENHNLYKAPTFRLPSSCRSTVLRSNSKRESTMLSPKRKFLPVPPPPKAKTNIIIKQLRQIKQKREKSLQSIIESRSLLTQNRSLHHHPFRINTDIPSIYEDKPQTSRPSRNPSVQKTCLTQRSKADRFDTLVAVAKDKMSTLSVQSMVSLNTMRRFSEVTKQRGFPIASIYLH